MMVISYRCIPSERESMAVVLCDIFPSTIYGMVLPVVFWYLPLPGCSGTCVTNARNGP